MWEQVHVLHVRRGNRIPCNFLVHCALPRVRSQSDVIAPDNGFYCLSDTLDTSQRLETSCFVETMLCLALPRSGFPKYPTGGILAGLQ